MKMLGNPQEPRINAINAVPDLRTVKSMFLEFVVNNLIRNEHIAQPNFVGSYPTSNPYEHHIAWLPQADCVLSSVCSFYPPHAQQREDDDSVVAASTISKY